MSLTTNRIAPMIGAALLAAFLVSCAAGDDGEPDAEAVDEKSGASTLDDGVVPSTPDTAANTSASTRGLSSDSTWQWQIQGDVNTSYDVDVYDIDLFDVPDAIIDELHRDGRLVVCYFSAGSYEDWRSDAGDFAAADRGEFLAGYDDEQWLDVRSPSVRAVMEQRLDLAVERGCDGVEPDNVDGYTNDNGLDLTADDQLDYNLFLSTAAHDRGLLVGLKNSGDQVVELVDHFDFAVNEQCHEYDECDQLTPFIDAAKPVFNAEYDEQFVDAPDEMCADSRKRSLRSLILPLDLDDSFRIDCGQ